MCTVGGPAQLAVLAFFASQGRGKKRNGREREGRDVYWRGLGDCRLSFVRTERSYGYGVDN